MTLLDWRIPAVWEDAPATPSPPREWGTLADLGRVVPTTGGRRQDLSINIFEGESLLRQRLIDKFGIGRSSVNLIESLLVAVVLSLSLAFGLTWVQRADPTPVSAPVGVDAYLSETDHRNGGGQTSEASSKVTTKECAGRSPRYMKTCLEGRSGSLMSVEDRLKVQRLISKGLANAEILEQMRAIEPAGASQEASRISEAGIQELRRDMMRIERGDFM